MASLLPVEDILVIQKDSSTTYHHPEPVPEASGSSPSPTPLRLNGDTSIREGARGMRNGALPFLGQEFPDKTQTNHS